MTKVLNSGQYVDFDEAFVHMDNDLREMAHDLLRLWLPCVNSEQRFLDIYCRLHFEKYQSIFYVN